MVIIRRQGLWSGNSAGFGSLVITGLEALAGLKLKHGIAPEAVFLDYHTKCYGGASLSDVFLFPDDKGKVYLHRNLMPEDWNYGFNEQYEISIVQLTIERAMWKKYFKIKPELLETSKQLIKQHDLQNCIGVYFRGTDKHSESISPSIEHYQQAIAEVDLRYSGKKLYVQSDDKHFYSSMEKLYPGRIITLPFKTSDKSIHQTGTKEDMYQCLDLILCLSSVEHLICNSSNVSHLAIINRPTLSKNVTYVEKYIYDSEDNLTKILILLLIIAVFCLIVGWYLLSK